MNPSNPNASSWMQFMRPKKQQPPTIGPQSVAQGTFNPLTTAENKFMNSPLGAAYNVIKGAGGPATTCPTCGATMQGGDSASEETNSGPSNP